MISSPFPEIPDSMNKDSIDLTEKIISENTYVVFTSPSTFNSFINKYNLKKNIISIGNTTTDHIRDKGFEPLMTAKMQSYEGISTVSYTHLTLPTILHV